MSLKRIIKSTLKTAAAVSPAGKVAKIAQIGSKLVSGAKKAMILPSSIGMAAVATALTKRRRRKYRGISNAEMMELMKLQMLVGKKSLPYQMAVMRSLFGKLR